MECHSKGRVKDKVMERNKTRVEETDMRSIIDCTLHQILFIKTDEMGRAYSTANIRDIESF
jgi:hypothetical protein